MSSFIFKVTVNTFAKTILVYATNLLEKPSKRMSNLVSFQCPVEGCEVMIPATTERCRLFLKTHNQSSHGALTAPLPCQETQFQRTAGEKKVRS